MIPTQKETEYKPFVPSNVQMKEFTLRGRPAWACHVRGIGCGQCLPGAEGGPDDRRNVSRGGDWDGGFTDLQGFHSGRKYRADRRIYR